MTPQGPDGWNMADTLPKDEGFVPQCDFSESGQQRIKMNCIFMQLITSLTMLLMHFLAFENEHKQDDFTT